jgi:predicted NUDIX family phosphoesterase
MCGGDEAKLHTFLTLEVSGHILEIIGAWVNSRISLDTLDFLL